jgi:hypothetical protein
MNWRLIVLVVATVAGPVLWWAEEWELRRAHARLRTRALNALRLGGAYTFLVAGLVIGSQPGSPSLVLLPLGLAVIGLAVVPMSWVLRAGGLAPIWEIRQVYRAASRQKGRGPTPLPAEIAAAQRRYRDRLEYLKAPATSEWINLMVADIDDWISSRYWLVDVGRRLIRLHEIDLEMLGAEAPAAERSPEEATFLWLLYRIFARMYDWGGAPRSPDTDDDFRSLAAQLDQFRRPDTEAFIDGIQASAHAWAASGLEAQWGRADGITGLGPDIDAEYWRLWPNLRVIWGAELDEDDRRELASSLRKRADSEQAP